MQGTRKIDKGVVNRAIARRIKKIRLDAGLSWNAFGDKIDAQAHQVKAWEDGSMVSIHYLLRIADQFDVTLQFLVMGRSK